MEVNGLNSPFAIQNPTRMNAQIDKKTVNEVHSQFKTALNDAIKDVNKLQMESSMATTKLVRGEMDNLHDVMIAGQKASIALQATVEVRNKVLESYQEIMRMQV